MAHLIQQGCYLAAMVGLMIKIMAQQNRNFVRLIFPGHVAIFQPAHQSAIIQIFDVIDNQGIFGKSGHTQTDKVGIQFLVQGQNTRCAAGKPRQPGSVTDQNMVQGGMD